MISTNTTYITINNYNNNMSGRGFKHRMCAFLIFYYNCL